MSVRRVKMVASVFMEVSHIAATAISMSRRSIVDGVSIYWKSLSSVIEYYVIVSQQ